MKKTIALLLAVMMLFAITACGNTAAQPEETDTAADVEAPAEEITLYVFAAASMTETLDQIIELYKAEAPNVTIIPTYDSSGTLKTQIQEGAACDIFISAAQKQMNQLDAAKDVEGGNEEGLDFVLSDSRVDLLENKVVLAVPDDNGADIQSFEDLGTDKLTLLCIGNEDVPVGAYSEEILTTLGILDTLQASGKLTYGSNVKEVTTQVKEGTVDAGIIYATDAFSAGLTVVAQADSSLCRQVIYPAAVLNITEHEQAARAFLAFLQSDAAMTVFESVGFAPAP
ncbi:MAG: molybdate ABC transporter substrate-binding protein [Oscillospiraceae bacterium]|nr:molybdate ABC transporter substrate-binding protein [Oscillospiraceae bacterium]